MISSQLIGDDLLTGKFSTLDVCGDGKRGFRCPDSGRFLFFSVVYTMLEIFIH